MPYLHLYNFILFVASCFLIPYYGLKIILTGKYRNSIGPKLGVAGGQSADALKGSPRIWVHAVSVGEVTAAAPIVASLRDMFPHACIVLSTSTETGQEMARRLVTAASAYLYYPLDIPWVVRKTLNRVRPDIFVPVETELWPNFIRICRERGVRIVMVNGRISPRSFTRYAQTRFFWKRLLAWVDAMGMISQVDADRIIRIGAAREKVRVEGNAKYDSLASRADDHRRDEMRRTLNLPEGSSVFVAGSTHAGEEHVILNVYKNICAHYPDFILIIVPRHIERSAEIVSLAADGGFSDCIRMSEIQKGKVRHGERIVLVDVIGELFRIYSLATVVFCGGSLVPRGGQNILEPAAWGKVIFYGPSMEDFVDEKGLLEDAGAGITVNDEADLTTKLLHLLADPAGLAARGHAGRRVVTSNKGAARRYAALIGAWRGDKTNG
jgi:3-deoxy-D-manno-octulosonic-acid transferase